MKTGQPHTIAVAPMMAWKDLSYQRLEEVRV